MRNHAGLVIFLLINLAVRIKLLLWWKPFPFGDVFNYVGIAQALAHFSYPVADKRLPFYPFLLLLGHSLMPGFAWETVAIAIAIIASLVALAMLYAIGRQLGFNKFAILLALTLYGAFQPFLTYAIRGYADTTFVALMAVAILLVLTINKRFAVPTLAVVLGCLMLTRYEGIVAVAVLWLLSLVHLHCLRVGRSVTARAGIFMIIIILVVVSPYVVIAYRSGRSLLPQAYLTQAASLDQGYGAKDLGDLKGRYWGMWDHLGLFDVYERPKILWGELRDDTWGFYRQIIDVIINSRTVAGWVGTLGIIVLLIRRRWFYLTLITLPYLAIALPIAWWAALTRYDAFVFPLMILTAMSGFDAMISWVRPGLALNTEGRRIGKIVSWIFFFLFGIGIWFWGAVQDTQGTLVKSRFRELAYYQAVQTAQRLPGPILFEQKRAIIDSYFAGREFFMEDLFSKDMSTEERWTTIRSHGIHTVLLTSRTARSVDFIQHVPPDVQVQSLALYSIEQGNKDTNRAEIINLIYQP